MRVSVTDDTSGMHLFVFELKVLIVSVFITIKDKVYAVLNMDDTFWCDFAVNHETKKTNQSLRDLKHICNT